MNWGKYPNFKRTEFECSHCGAEGVQEKLIEKLQALRLEYGKPMRITSGYRCPDHPVEARKAASGAHTTGKAADIAVEGRQAHELLRQALDMNFKGIGVQQKGTGRFIHLDDWIAPNRPTVWSY